MCENHKQIEVTDPLALERRSFLKAAAGFGVLSFGLPMTGLLNSVMAEEGKRSLVVLYLRGGMDAMNTIVPYADPRYYEMRPTIAIPPEDNDWGEGCIQLDKTFGFHPAMRSLMPLYEAGRLAPIVNVGSPHNTRSHFDAQDFMEYAAPGMRTIKDGWLNRYLALRTEEVKAGAEAAAELPIELRALAMQGLLPRSLRGSAPALAVPSDDILGQGEMLDLFGEIYGGLESGGTDLDEEGKMMMGKRKEDADSVVNTGRVTLDSLKRYKEIISSKTQASTGVAYPRGALGTRLERIAKVIKSDAGLEVACVDVPGWDHHADEGGVDGTLSRMLKNLSDSLSTFMTDLGEHADRTCVMVMTEFGRTCRENGNDGTDHGRGGAMFVLGGGVQGGKVHGDWPGLADTDLIEARDLPVTTDFRNVFAEVLSFHMGVKLPQDFFPNYMPQRVPGLFKS